MQPLESRKAYDKRILIAGMKRSGSTWLYNVVRFCYINAGHTTYGDYIDKYESHTCAHVHVVKIHPFDPTLMVDTDRILTSIRDIRDAVASMVRRNLINNCKEEVIEAARNMISSEHLCWAPFSDLEVRYEYMITHRMETVEMVLALLGIESVDPAEVVNDVEKLGRVVFPGRERTSQLWPNHITDGRSNAYLDTFESETIRAVEHECAEWLAANGYG